MLALKDLKFQFVTKKDKKFWTKEITASEWQSFITKIPKYSTFTNLGYEFIPISEKDKLDNYYKTTIIDDNKSLDLSYSDKSSLNIELPGGKLFPFQNATVEYSLKKDSVLIADEMGLGKSLESLAIIDQKKSYPVLIICPAIAKYNWEAEIKKWLNNNNIIILSGRNDDSDISKFDFVIANYEIVIEAKNTKKTKQTTLQTLSKAKFETLICDESHKLGNKKSKISKTMINAFLSIPNKMLLSGTPFKNGPYELITQLKLLGVLKKFGGVSYFTRRYCNPELTQFGMQYGSANELELQENLRKICMIRHKKEDVLLDLPDKIKQEVYFDIDLFKYKSVKDKVKDWYNKKLNEFKKELEAEEYGIFDKHMMIAKKKEAMTIAEKMVMLNFAMQEVAKLKMEQCYQFIQDYVDSGSPCIVFAYHRDIVDMIYEKFKDVSVMLKGGMADEAKNIQDEFQNNPDKKIFVGSIMASSTNLTLTKASGVIFVELPWTPADVDQGESRAQRIGQKNTVNVYYLLAKNTIDEHKINLIKTKQDIFDKSIEIDKLIERMIQ